METPHRDTFLQQFTEARIALGRVGVSVPTEAMLQFQWAHAQARDQVAMEIDIQQLTAQLHAIGFKNVMDVQSKCASKQQYLKRPDWGRKLSDNSIEKLMSFTFPPIKIGWVIADGLSSGAIHNHVVPFFQAAKIYFEHDLTDNSPIFIVKYGRVAIGDEIANLQKMDMVVVLIGERPGLTAPDSMGIYITYQAQPGTTDEARNCISNVRIGGLPYAVAASNLHQTVADAFIKKLTGVALKPKTHTIE